MGLPIAKLICASNENKVLFDFFQTGTYDKNREFILTESPSMDILISSNLERLIYLISERNASKNRELMKELKEKGRYGITPEMKAKLADFAAGYASEEEMRQAIRETYERTGYVMDTAYGGCGSGVSCVQRGLRGSDKDDYCVPRQVLINLPAVS